MSKKVLEPTAVKSSQKKEVIVKYPFSIQGVNFKEIIDNHFQVTSDIEYVAKKSKKTYNKSISPLFVDGNEKTSKKLTCFLDAKKNKIKLWPIMVDSDGSGVLPLSTTKPCRNCHHTFTTQPIGCPIRYIPELDEKDPVRIQIINFLKKNNYQHDTNYCFLTEKIFCCEPCIKSYILQCISVEPWSSKYNNALSYLTMMVKKKYDIKGVPDRIKCADTIDCLEAYGGHVNINDYRDEKRNVKYENTINIKRPIMFSCTQFIEEISDTKV